MPQIECTGVSLAYERGVVLRDLTFSVERGDYLCVVGENGSGKSTLAKALLGLKAPLGGVLFLTNRCAAAASAICRSSRPTARISPHLSGR